MVDYVATIGEIEAMANLTPYEKMALVSMIASIRFLVEHKFIEDKIDLDSVVATFANGCNFADR